MTIQRGKHQNASGNAHNASVQPYPYHRDNYDLTFKSKALGWLVQFSIRADLAASELPRPRLDENLRPDPYADLSEAANLVRELIRNKHVLDERDLKEAGLSLYSFPSLANFFYSGERQNFVKEVSINETWEILLEASSQAVTRTLTEPNELTDANGLYELCSSSPIGKWKLNQIRNKYGRDSPARMLCLVDLAAPQRVLKEQFRQIVERMSPKKWLIESRYSDWDMYGVLPLIDLEGGLQANEAPQVNDSVKANFLYRKFTSYDTQTVSAKSRPLSREALTPGSEDFASLLAAANDEFDTAISFAQGDCPSENRDAAEEALVRWFPSTYPYDLPYIERGLRSAAHRGRAHFVLSSLKQTGYLELGIIERIRKMAYDGGHDLSIMQLLAEIYLSDPETQSSR